MPTNLRKGNVNKVGRINIKKQACIVSRSSRKRWCLHTYIEGLCEHVDYLPYLYLIHVYEKGQHSGRSICFVLVVDILVSIKYLVSTYCKLHSEAYFLGSSITSIDLFYCHTLHRRLILLFKTNVDLTIFIIFRSSTETSGPPITCAQVMLKYKWRAQFQNSLHVRPYYMFLIRHVIK